MPNLTLFKQEKLKIVLVAGEASGDILGAGLMKALKNLHPSVEFFGVSGPLMQQEGCKTWYEMEELSVMGVVEVLGRLPRILSIRRSVKKQTLALKPDLFIGIDAPDFNLDLEGALKKNGIKTVHYVSPSVWAWKQKRVFKIKKNVDLMLTFLPFEKAFYDKFQVPCVFIGHKMADDIALSPDKIKARNQLNLPLEATVLTLLPGSRFAEVSMLTEPFLLAAQQISKIFPHLKILVPLANQKRYDEFFAILKKLNLNLDIKLLHGQAREAMTASDVAILASGTVALECMLSKCPMVVGYKLKPFTYWIAKKLIKTPYVALPNLLAKKELVKEFLQEECTPENLAQQAIRLLTQDQTHLIEVFLTLHRSIRHQADLKAAKAVLDLIAHPSSSL